MSTLGGPPAASPAASLHRDLKDIVRHAPGRISVQVEDESGVVAGWDAERVVPAASLIKVLTLVTVLDRVDAGELNLDGAFAIPAARVGGSGALALLPSVEELSLVELCRLMIALSDNDAGNLILQIVGNRRVAALGRRLGLTQTTVDRAFMDAAAREEGRDNLTTAADQAMLLALIRSGRALSADSTRLALALLGEQQGAPGLTGLLPQHVVHGSKTGDLPGLRHDVALVESAGRWASVAVLATDMYDARHDQDYSASVLPAFSAIGEAVLTYVESTTSTQSEGSATAEGSATG